MMISVRLPKSSMRCFAGENLPKARIALGTIVQEIKDVSRSYKEARMALDVGKDLLQ